MVQNTGLFERTMEVHAGPGLEGKLTVHFDSTAASSQIHQFMDLYNANLLGIDDKTAAAHRKPGRIVSVSCGFGDSGVFGLHLAVEYADIYVTSLLRQTVTYEPQHMENAVLGLGTTSIGDISELVGQTVFAYFFERTMIGLSKAPPQKIAPSPQSVASAPAEVLTSRYF